MKVLRKEKGISLLETLVVIAILGMLSGGLLKLARSENIIIKNSAEMLNARLRANAIVETLKACPFEELKSFSSLITSDIKDMTIDVVVSDFEDSQALKKIVVTVNWLDQRENEKNYMLTTLRTSHPQPSVKSINLQAGTAGGEK